jgi:hypothetical protein
MRSQPFRLWAVLVGGTLAAGLASWSLSTRAQAAPDSGSKATLTHGFQKGAWDYKAIGPLAFSPSGVLFFADDQAGAIYGVDLGEKPSHAASYAKVPGLGATLAARLGTTANGIEIRDMAVSPVSHAVYLSVRKTDGADQNPANPQNYALFAVDPSGKVSPVDLADKPFGKASVSGKPGYGGRGASPARIIGDITYARGRVLAAVLSDDAFKSNLVSVPVPFRQDGAERYATSIYHVSHHRQETASPIQTLTTYRDGDKEYLMAAYICTPVVRFNLEDLKPNQEATGTTVAELGSGNQPMAMIAYGKAGEQSLLLNNSVFGILKVDAKIAKETQAVNQMTAASRGSGGKTPYPGIEPVEALKGAKAYAAGGDSLLVVKPAGNGMALEAMPLP